MATTKTEEKKTESKDLQTTSSAALPAFLTGDMASEAAQYAGEGTSGRAEDNVLPFLSLLQDMSPEAKKRDPNYVEGAEPGFVLNKATRQLFPCSVEDGGKEGEQLFVQPCAFQRVINEWIPRDMGGGFVARHEFDDTLSVEDNMKKLGARQMKDPRDSKGQKMIWVKGEGSELHDMIDTRYHYVNIMMPDGTTQPAVMSFSSTGHTASRAWMTLQRNAKIPTPNGQVVAPAWFKKYRVRALPKQNEKGEFFVLTFDDLGNDGWIQDANIRASGRDLNEAFQTGNAKAGVEEEGTGAPAGGASADEDVEI